MDRLPDCSRPEALTDKVNELVDYVNLRCLDCGQHKRTLTIKEAADVLGCHPNNVWKMIREGSLTAFRLGPGGSPYRIRWADLQQFIHENRFKP